MTTTKQETARERFPFLIGKVLTQKILATMAVVMLFPFLIGKVLTSEAF